LTPAPTPIKKSIKATSTKPQAAPRAFASNVKKTSGAVQVKAMVTAPEASNGQVPGAATAKPEKQLRSEHVTPSRELDVSEKAPAPSVKGAVAESKVSTITTEESNTPPVHNTPAQIVDLTGDASTVTPSTFLRS